MPVYPRSVTKHTLLSHPYIISLPNFNNLHPRCIKTDICQSVTSDKPILLHLLTMRTWHISVEASYAYSKCPIESFKKIFQSFKMNDKKWHAYSWFCRQSTIFSNLVTFIIVCRCCLFSVACLRHSRFTLNCFAVELW